MGRRDRRRRKKARRIRQRRSRLLPPRLDRAIGERIAWYEHAVRQLGGHPEVARTDDRELYLFRLVEHYLLLGGRMRKLKDMYNPPLGLPVPKLIPEALADRELDRWRELLAKREVYVVGCPHLPAREAMERVVDLLEKEHPGPAYGGAFYLMISDDCEECLLDWEIEMAEEARERPDSRMEAAEAAL